MRYSPGKRGRLPHSGSTPAALSILPIKGDSALMVSVTLAGALVQQLEVEVKE